jgi:putative peptide zinc metalloprotease protein
VTRTKRSSKAAARRITPLLVLLACALPAGSAQAAAPTENIATATIEQDNGRAFDFAWAIAKQRGGVVDHVNAANAAARCSHCEATAIAFQIVIASDAERVAPINQAVALNQACTECAVVAEARQFVRVVDAPVKLTGRGRAELADVRQDLADLEALDPPIDQLHQAVELQEARVRDILGRELVMKADPESDADVLDAWVAQRTELE